MSFQINIHKQAIIKEGNYMYLIIGANGFLGSYLVDKIKQETNEKIIATSRNTELLKSSEQIKWVSCDVTSFQSVKSLKEECGDISDCKIFYFAAYHNLDNVKRNPQVAWNVNITALSNFVNQFRDADSFFFASSDCVYGEGNTDSPFKENDEKKPINEYGRQKLLGEKIVSACGFNSLRLAYMIGPSLAKGKKHFYDMIIEKTGSFEAINMADGLYRSALSYKTAAEMLYKISLLDLKALPEVLNICSDKPLTKYEVAAAVAEKENCDMKYIRELPESEISKFFYENRASYAGMDNTLLKNILNIKEIELDF